MNSNPLNSLTAISPVDGRYRNTTEKLADYFSEQALIRYRIRVEVEYFIALCELPLPQLADIDRTKFAAPARPVPRLLAPADAGRVKEIESVTNHDVKAIEYMHQGENGQRSGWELTRNSYISASPRRTSTTRPSRSRSRTRMAGGLLPGTVEEVRDKLAALRRRMARRADAGPHPRPAGLAHDGWARSSWSLSNALEKQLAMLHDIAVPAKFGGATGNFNAHRGSLPRSTTG